jgi:cellulose synthase/poly-beta-1,6-N-acetylglucosamine synthase-like glycosyltransferase
LLGDANTNRFGAVDRGWKVKYVTLCLATGICPNTPRSFFSQQMRWARGSTTLLTTKHFWTSNLTFMQKVCYLCGKRPPLFRLVISH